MQIYRYFFAVFIIFSWLSSLHAISIKLDGTGGITDGTDCQAGAIYRFGTENTYDGKNLDLLVEVLDADNDYAEETGKYCTYVKDHTLATNLRDTDSGDNMAFEAYEITIVEKGTTTPVEVDRVMLTGYDLDINKNGGTDTDDIYVAADGAYISSDSLVKPEKGTFYNFYTDKMKGWDGDNCYDTAETPDSRCRASSVWINGNGVNKVSTIKVRVQNDNAYGEYTGDSYAYRLIQLSFQIEDFSLLFEGQKDYGDAPSTYGEAGGKLDATVMLGNGLPADAESSYQASGDASGDDTHGHNDEGSVTVDSGTSAAPLTNQTFNAGDNATLNITTYGSGYLQVWCDFNSDGDFNDNGEHVIDSQQITKDTSAGSGVTSTPITLTIPTTVHTGNSFIRVRFSEGDSSDEITAGTFVDKKGEIEDYQIHFKNEGSISGNVKDTDGNPLANITIKLYKGTEENATTTTDNHGDYLFSMVSVGDYTVKDEDSLASSITDEDSSDDNDTNDNSNTTDKSIPVTITVGEDDEDNNFIHTITRGSISGFVKDTTNQPLAGASIKLVKSDGSDALNTAGNVIAPITTQANGAFSFSDIPVGFYTLLEVDPTGYISESDDAGDDNTSNTSPTDNMIPVTLLADENDSDNIFIDKGDKSISGHVKADTDFDEVVDTPLKGVKIELHTADAELLQSTRTDNNGTYIFHDVAPGSYTIKEIDPQGYASLGDSDGGDMNTIMIELSEQDIIDQNFDDQKRITVSGIVKVDIDGDKIVDEPLKNSTLIICKEAAPCDANSHIQQALTGEDGAYTFDNLTPGAYQIIEIDKEGYESLGDSDGANDNTIHLNLTGMGDVTGQDFENQATAPKFIILKKSVGKKQASIGDFVPYSISVENIDHSYHYATLSIRDILPAGFKYEKGSARLIRGPHKTALHATGTNTIKFGTFNLNEDEKVTITYLLKVGVSVAKGTLINRATAEQNGEDVSNTSTASITIVADAFVDNSVVVGKVFDDQNANGIQDADEKGIPGVRIATPTGMLIETDGYGRYHVADAENSGFSGRGSNYILKVDPATLPEGSTFTTENPRVYRLTSSALNVIDFGVKLPKAERFSKERIIKKVTLKKELVKVDTDIKIGSIYFDSDQDCIRPNQVQALCTIAKKIKKYGSGSIMIEGNTDARAPMWYNKKLAYKRARSVYKELKQQLGDAMIGKVEVIYDNCNKEVKFNPRYDWWGKPNIPRTKKECTEFGFTKTHCNRVLAAKRGGAL